MYNNHKDDIDFPQNINIRKELRERLLNSLNRYNMKLGDNMGTSAYVNKVLKYYMDKEDWLHSYQPNFSVVGVENGVLHLRDGNKVYQIKRIPNSKRLKCIEDKDERCDHVIYAYASLDIVRLFQS